VNEPSTVVSPGLWGFVAFFVLAVSLYLLMRNMNARMRRMSYRAEELQRQAEAEQEERRRRKDGGTVPDSNGTAGPPERPGASGPDLQEDAPREEDADRRDGDDGRSRDSRQDGEPAP
jgi:hypothetical protein